MPSVFTCMGCGKLIGCCGWLPSGEEAPLYAERVIAAAATANSPAREAQFLLNVTSATWYGGSRSWGGVCEHFHKARRGKNERLRCAAQESHRMNRGSCEH